MNKPWDRAQAKQIFQEHGEKKDSKGYECRENIQQCKSIYNARVNEKTVRASAQTLHGGCSNKHELRWGDVLKEENIGRKEENIGISTLSPGSHLPLSLHWEYKYAHLKPNSLAPLHRI